MPRKARIDAPGALICRGIERSNIFRSDHDHEDFISRLELVLLETQTPCYAWALIANHFHLLLRTGKASISTVMRRILSGYAGGFNRRHQRSGHLFQNRYKSILCQDDLYLKELVRYIHLNPLRAKLVKTLSELDRYRFCGHSVVMGHQKSDLQETETVLSFFGKRMSAARRAYRLFVEKGISIGKRPDLTGGGLIRSHGGWSSVKALGKLRIHLKGDKRILGDSDFVQSVLAAQNEKLERHYWLENKGYDFQAVMDRGAEVLGVEADDIIGSKKKPLSVRARSVVCYWAVTELGMTTVDVARLIGIGQSAVTKAVQRGGNIVKESGVHLIE